MLTEIQKIVLTCLLGPEDRTAWKRERHRDRLIKFRTPETNAKYAEEKRRRRIEDPEFAAHERAKAKKRRDDSILGKVLIGQAKSRRRHRRELFNLLKFDRPCYDCGGMFPPEATDWDHLPGSKKLFNIGASVYTYSVEEVADEIAKCQLVCATCHRIRTAKRKKEGK